MDKTDKNLHINFWYIIAAVLGMLLIQDLYLESTKLTPIPYSRFETLLKEDKIDKIAIAQNYISGTLKEAQPDGLKEFITVRVDPELAQILNQHGVTYSGVVENHWLRDLLSWILPAAFFVGIWMFAIRRMGQGGLGGLMQIGKSRARIYVEKETKVTFADVAGVDEAKDELVEIVNFLKDPIRYGRLGGRPPKGVLLVGPPGTGKTLLARAVAGEAGVPFFSISGSEFVEMFVGVGASRVRDMFAQARRNSPCIVFVDEIDAVGRQRGAGLGGSHDEREQTLNQILVEMDGFDTNTNVIVIAATNRPDVLDPALLRPGRFDRQVVLDRPDIRGRSSILQVHAKGKPLETSVTLEDIARQSPGFSGADLANLVNEGAILAARRNRKVVTMTDFEEALERVVAGPARKSRIISEREKAITAYHEVGHALVARMLPNTDPVHKVSIVARGQAGGFTMLLPTEDRYLWSKPQFEDMLAYV